MKNFITWLTEYLQKTDPDMKWDKYTVNMMVKDIHTTLLSEEDLPYMGKHYGDCIEQNISCMICEYQNWLDAYELYCKNEINIDKLCQILEKNQ